ncbi:LTA synthase family protein [Vibrio splendidus]|uniref:LTA synthase family protein n=1 Tax=Vibrio TaxID=662 RepID=UPI000C81E747|nr:MULTISPECIES: LTA synthase family protein [Vibrio]MBO7913645.1 LTA synthase family protein [Vibrio sp. G41H]MCF7492580.1 LTA synthase family protein [Vibrio sp. G-C-1]PMO38653.1 phosphoglycerol transferase [Vibrio splendidus]
MFQDNIKKLTRIIWIQVALFTIFASLFRQVFTFLIGDVTEIYQVIPDYIQSIVIGLRFDLRVATIAFAPLFLLGLILSGTKPFKIVNKIIPIYSFVIYFLGISVSIGNYYYYKTYSNHFDIFMFGLVEDDTSAVLLTMWQDYPIIITSLISLLTTITLLKITLFVWERLDTKTWPKQRGWVTALTLFVTIAAYFVLARGSIGTFPLKQYHANVSNYEVLNKVTPNAFLALDWARSEHKRSASFTAVKRADLEEKVHQVLGQDEPIYHTDKNDYLESNKPNVVFALMESMGTNLLVEDNGKTTDLLGSLRPHYENDFSFERFLPGTGGTINSIVMMLFHSNVNSISHGKEQNTPLPGSAFLPYKKAGYKVIYITGGSPLWRNLKYYMPVQGVDEFYSEEDIYEAFPESVEYASTWGAADEFTFKLAEKLLKENTQPVMVMIQTQTNHPPYQIPSNYTPGSIEVSEYAMKKMSLSEENSKKIYETYQYSSNALGDFISDIKDSELNSNTIISASGDHRLRNYSISYPKDLGVAHAVPFYLYVPQEILLHSKYRYQENRIGSHRDIFPTLYSFSLSNAEYTSLGGRNLLADKDVSSPYAYTSGVTFTPLGVSHSTDSKAIYPWKHESNLAVERAAIPNPTPNIDVEHSKLQTLFINSQMRGFRAQ